MPNDERRVLVHVQGSLRSGSTLLETLLTQQPGTATVGESLNLYRFLQQDLPCSCGRGLRSCPVWGEVAEDVGLLDGGFDLAAFATRFRSVVRIRNLHRVLLRHEVPDDVRRIHRAVIDRFADLTGARTVIDTSKNPAMPHVVDGPDWRWRTAYIHLVRDPRAVAFSDSRTRHAAADDMRPPWRSPAVSAALWSLTNSAVEWNRRHDWAGQPFVRVRYEDLTGDVCASMRELAEALQIAAPAVVEAVAAPAQPASGPATSAPPQFTLSALSAGHAIGGNPGRPQGNACVRRDERWRTEMPDRDRILVAALTRPLLRRYGYR